MKRLIAWISDLRLAIGLLILIAIASGLGTLVPQQENAELYHRVYDAQPWLGLLNGDAILRLQLDHVYSSNWFLGLLAWLGLSLILCSWRRQWPALQAALRWIDYSSPRQLSKLTLAETLSSPQADTQLGQLQALLLQRGWQVQPHPHRLAARRGVSGRVGPLLVHAGLVVLMVGAAWGALAGQRLERYLAPGNELELLNRRGETQLTVALEGFGIERDPAGRPEQFRSQLRLQPGDPAASAPLPATNREISVNHPLRFQGMTVYQADWALAAIQVQLGKSPILELPLQSFPQLGDQVWGIVLPTRPDGSNPVLLALSSEQGPVTVYSADAEVLGTLVPGGGPAEIAGIPLRIASVVPASGLLLKRDPGVPLVYAGFAIALAGGALSLIATRQLWAIAEPEQQKLHVAGLCNRNLAAFSRELPALLTELQQA
ncbi:cytochrome C biogenesis protein CcsB [Synechococcus sp. CB0101]|jgi:cytochrome c biogenesis protein|uniref:cytochrome c biogenesis protein ResB n=1 Tax=Synechococcus sp. CB0101 TaxID=232348 RepID=UPI0002001BFF|nr:cytochrome c biogenesis protein ResB [Synechococcus sp. CB0101]QCH14685.1 cytochrome C biogenesis protein CcsB [Synechococcus sp. CB0101]